MWSKDDIKLIISYFGASDEVIAFIGANDIDGKRLSDIINSGAASSSSGSSKSSSSSSKGSVDKGGKGISLNNNSAATISNSKDSKDNESGQKNYNYTLLSSIDNFKDFTSFWSEISLKGFSPNFIIDKIQSDPQIAAKYKVKVKRHQPSSLRNSSSGENSIKVGGGAVSSRISNSNNNIINNNGHEEEGSNSGNGSISGGDDPNSATVDRRSIDSIEILRLKREVDELKQTLITQEKLSSESNTYISELRNVADQCKSQLERTSAEIESLRRQLHTERQLKQSILHLAEECETRYMKYEDEIGVLNTTILNLEKKRRNTDADRLSKTGNIEDFLSQDDNNSFVHIATDFVGLGIPLNETANAMSPSSSSSIGHPPHHHHHHHHSNHSNHHQHANPPFRAPQKTNKSQSPGGNANNHHDNTVNSSNIHNSEHANASNKSSGNSNDDSKGGSRSKGRPGGVLGHFEQDIRIIDNETIRAEWFVANSEYDPYPKDNYYYDNNGIGTGTNSIEEVQKRENIILSKAISNQATRKVAHSNVATRPKSVKLITDVGLPSERRGGRIDADQQQQQEGNIIGGVGGAIDASKSDGVSNSNNNHFSNSYSNTSAGAYIDTGNLTNNAVDVVDDIKAKYKSLSQKSPRFKYSRLYKCELGIENTDNSNDNNDNGNSNSNSNSHNMNNNASSLPAGSPTITTEDNIELKPSPSSNVKRPVSAGVNYRQYQQKQMYIPIQPALSSDSAGSNDKPVYNYVQNNAIYNSKERGVIFNDEEGPGSSSPVYSNDKKAIKASRPLSARSTGTKNSFKVGLGRSVKPQIQYCADNTVDYKSPRGGERGGSAKKAKSTSQSQSNIPSYLITIPSYYKVTHADIDNNNNNNNSSSPRGNQKGGKAVSQYDLPSFYSKTRKIYTFKSVLAKTHERREQNMKEQYIQSLVQKYAGLPSATTTTTTTTAGQNDGAEHTDCDDGDDVDDGDDEHYHHNQSDDAYDRYQKASVEANILAAIMGVGQYVLREDQGGGMDEFKI